ncbi:hypothetical protein [Rhodococcus sp. RD6.2]|jgi:hypothetical protein|uniref:hypothetical protein n=1 Tax=Rhodococcus sp. RD6.2 TaxID=260936 RepID=UPI00155D9B27|nr:hypothetical protein [Rhodococcus sp. RD6.2]
MPTAFDSASKPDTQPRWSYERAVFVAPRVRSRNAQPEVVSAVDLDELRYLVSTTIGDENRFSIESVSELFGHTARVSVFGCTETETAVIADVVAAQTLWEAVPDREFDRIAARTPLHRRTVGEEEAGRRLHRLHGHPR